MVHGSSLKVAWPGPWGHRREKGGEGRRPGGLGRAPLSHEPFTINDRLKDELFNHILRELDILKKLVFAMSSFLHFFVPKFLRFTVSKCHPKQKTFEHSKVHKFQPFEFLNFVTSYFEFPNFRDAHFSKRSRTDILKFSNIICVYILYIICLNSFVFLMSFATHFCNN